jgi:hypothetical protein
MGFWGVQPMQNDGACDWMGDRVAPVLVKAIEDTLLAFLDNSDDEIEQPEAEAAAALLVDCTGSMTKTKYQALDIHALAEDRRLWDLALKVVDSLIEEKWWSGWKDPQAKLDALKELRADLERVKKENQKV